MSLLIDDLDAFLSGCCLSVEDQMLARDIYFEHPGDLTAVAKAWQAEPRLHAIGGVYGWENLTISSTS